MHVCVCVSMFVCVILYVCFCVFCNHFYDSTHALLCPSSSHTYLAVFLLDAVLLNQCTLSSLGAVSEFSAGRCVLLNQLTLSSQSWCLSRLAGYSKLTQTVFYLAVTYSDPLRFYQDLMARVNLHSFLFGVNPLRPIVYTPLLLHI